MNLKEAFEKLEELNRVADSRYSDIEDYFKAAGSFIENDLDEVVGAVRDAIEEIKELEEQVEELEKEKGELEAQVEEFETTQ